MPTHRRSSSERRRDPIRVFGPEQLTYADPSPGMRRQRAFTMPGLWSGQVVTAPGAVSGWHHHDSNASALYVVRGVLRFECEGVQGWVDALPGDFVQVPPHTIHRESNPGDEPSVCTIARAGTGVSTVNVERAPAPHG